MGHSGFECNQDPNFKTVRGTDAMNQMQVEMLRLQKIDGGTMFKRKRVFKQEEFKRYLDYLFNQVLDKYQNQQLDPSPFLSGDSPYLSLIASIKSRLLEFDDYNYSAINQELRQPLHKRETVRQNTGGLEARQLLMEI